MTPRLYKAQIRLRAELRRCDVRDGNPPPYSERRRFEPSSLQEILTKHSELQIGAAERWGNCIPACALTP